MGLSLAVRLLALSLLFVLASAATAAALPSWPTTRTVGPDGNLWALHATETEASILRITPDQEITTFGLPANRRPRAIAAGPEGKLWFAVADTATKRLMLQSITTGGALSEPIDLGPDRYSVHLAVSKDAVVWVPNELDPCIAGADGGLWRVDTRTRHLQTVAPSRDADGHYMATLGAIAVDAADRLLFYALRIYGDIPSTCGQGGGPAAVAFFNRNGAVDSGWRVAHREFPCFNDPVTASDGVVWCTGTNSSIYRVPDPTTDDYKGWDFPDSWSSPQDIVPGPGGGVWFMHGVFADGTASSTSSTVASISPTGEGREYPALSATIAANPIPGDYARVLVSQTGAYWIVHPALSRANPVIDSGPSTPPGVPVTMRQTGWGFGGGFVRPTPRPSPTPEPTPEASPAPAPAVQSAPAPVATPAPAALTIKASGVQRAGGLRLTVTAPAAGKAMLEVTLPAATARRLKLKRAPVKGTMKVLGRSVNLRAGTQTLKVALPTVAKALRSGKPVKATVRVKAGKTVATTTVTVRR
jgi:hypothetical protein